MEFIVQQVVVDIGGSQWISFILVNGTEDVSRVFGKSHKSPQLFTSLWISEGNVMHQKHYLLRWLGVPSIQPLIGSCSTVLESICGPFHTPFIIPTNDSFALVSKSENDKKYIKNFIVQRLVEDWSKKGQGMVLWWSKTGKRLDKDWSKKGQRLAKEWSRTGQRLVKDWSKTNQRLVKD